MIVNGGLAKPQLFFGDRCSESFGRMENRLEITFEGDHVLVLADGDKDYRYMDRMWREISLACDKHNCTGAGGPLNLLEDFFNRSRFTQQAYDLPAIFRELGIGQHYRIAWVELEEDSRSVIEFITTVLNNRGLPGRLFESEAEARAWLLGPA